MLNRYYILDHPREQTSSVSTLSALLVTVAFHVVRKMINTQMSHDMRLLNRIEDVDTSFVAFLQLYSKNLKQP